MTHDASRRDFLKLTGRAALLTAVAAPAASLLTAGPAAAETGAMWWPVTGKVNDLIGSRPGGKHDGIDIEAASGTAVYAAYDGVARRKEERDKNRNLVGYGQYIDVEHAGGWTTRYAHLSAYVIANGATVTRGTLIGKVGSTGRSTGPHLHFEARRNGTRYDNMNTATKTGAQVKEKTPITVDFAGLGAA